MKTIVFVIFVLVAAGCRSALNSPTGRLNKLDPPIILIAEDEMGNVTLRDNSNYHLTLTHTYYLAKTISATYNIGDTITHIKREPCHY